MAKRIDLFSTPIAAPLMERIEAKSIEMKNHRVFGLLHTIDDLHTFMSWHVFAVWDFMSLVKRLQIEFTSLNLPWTPPRNPETARLINEIVLGEETDVAPPSSHLSHYELYIAAMEEVGACALQITTFTDLLAANMPISDALKLINAPAAIREFVTSTVNLATKGSVEQVLGSFVFGREDAIPEMFQSLLRTWKIDKEAAPTFVFYLQRHIQLDADEHAPAAMRMLADQVAGDTGRLVALLEAAIAAIKQRIKLWDSLAETLESQRSPHQELAEGV
ncbi:DUF3050 domain-containing protein [Pseudothauera rhizosphaerae]|uniref:DUF3050 domain-containing protein n=1 Tax=Pseudothauera rhizosphaerae TaxID=2565932 RepID=A0A4S4ABA3_9RHOO|nr:DUF3050 domain-containing protein [Pseudothauera rhizosphaerae]THF56229.1 DUF3050 domain-containing protein [Pseudothauera rhizosphaerae]